MTRLEGRIISFLKSFALAAVMGLTMGTTGHAAPAFDRLVVFGDSLSDSGNAGRFSNGPVWVEQLADRIGTSLRPSRSGGSNYAVGGARLDPGSGPNSLRAQADLYLKDRPPQARTLHIVYGGGNDLLAAAGLSQGQDMLDRAVKSLAGIVDDLVRRGATDILVPNLPDIGITPEVQAHGRQAMEGAARLSQHFNAALDRALARFAGTPGLRLYRLDVWTMAQRVRSDPAAFGFRNITSACNRLPTCEGYLFWDGIHPTTQAHGRLAEAAFQLISAQ
jgi:phospholipase/lecithinase/hemolysin